MTLQLADNSPYAISENPSIKKFYCRVATMPGILVREDALDKYSDQALAENGVELSRGGKQRRAARKETKRTHKAEKKQTKVEKKKAKVDNKKAKAEFKRAKGQAKITKAAAKKDKANNPRGKFDWKQTASDVIDTAGQAVAVYKGARGGEDSEGGNYPMEPGQSNYPANYPGGEIDTGASEPSFFEKNKTPILIGAGLLVAAFVVPKLLPKTR